MNTLTLYIDHVLTSEIGSTEYQLVEKLSKESITYSNLVISGSRFNEVLFQDVIFENCTFFGTVLANCLFINCLFINCKFQFSNFSDCNFESTTWENCIWGLTNFTNSDIQKSEGKNNYSFESTGTFTGPQVLSLNEFLTISA